MSPKAYYSVHDSCWYVPVSSEIFASPESVKAEPVRVALRDGLLHITLVGDPQAKPDIATAVA